MPKKKEIEHVKVFYQRNVDLEIDPECHECISHAKDKNGYPEIRRSGRRMYLHRYIYEQFTGGSPEAVMHLCDNPSCINTSHLTGGTLKDNNVDKALKGRSSFGERHWNSRLTETDLLFIKTWIKLGYTIRSVAKAFGIHESNISRIKSGERWRHA